MSRVIYSDQQATGAQDALRGSNGVRLVTEAEEGTGVNALPNGVYGFTYSPGLPSAPLFAVRRYRSFEVHKLPSGDVCIIGFATADEAGRMASNIEDLTLRLYAQPEDGRETLVLVPISRIRQHRQHAAPNQEGFTVTLAPA